MNVNMEVGNTSSTILLPEEVLMDIFELLENRDRKNARLVCKSWLRILRRPYFTRMEVFLFPECYDFSTFVEFIDKISRNELNLKFRNRQILQNSKFFWQKYGQKIKSLHFSGCSFDPDTLLHIFEHCVELEEFISSGFCGMSSYVQRNPARKSFWHCGFDNLRREKLLRLDLDFKHSLTDSFDLTCIASMFPNLKILDIRLKKKYMDSCISTLHNLLQTKMRHIERLNICLPNCVISKNACSLQNFISSISTMEISLALRLESDILTEKHIRQISSYKFLTSLKVRGAVVHATLFARFIDENQMLQELRFDLSLNEISDFCTIWTALVNSHLKSLEINFGVSDQLVTVRNSVQVIDSALDGLKKNFTVGDLIVIDIQGDEFNFLFAKYFQGVVDVNFWGAEPSTIFQYLTQLRSLGMRVVNSRNVTSSPTSIQSVEYMNVCDNAVELFSLYRFPNLMYVAVHFREYFHQCQIEQNIRGGKISCLLNDDLQTLASILLLHSPKLRGVHLLSDAAEMKMFEFFFQFCRNFPHLHYIYLTGRSCRALDKSDLMQKVTKLVSQSSSVKTVWIETRDFYILYVLNPVTQQYEFLSQYHQIFQSLNLKLKDAWKKKR